MKKVLFLLFLFPAFTINSQNTLWEEVSKPYLKSKKKDYSDRESTFKCGVVDSVESRNKGNLLRKKTLISDKLRTYHLAMTDLPDYIQVVNPELGTVSVISNILNGGKRFLNLAITGNNPTINWELLILGDGYRSHPMDNFQGFGSLIEGMETIKITFVDGPLNFSIPNTKMQYRHDFVFGLSNYSKDFVISAYNYAITKMQNSRAKELINTLNNRVPSIDIISDIYGVTGWAGGPGGIIEINIYNSNSTAEIFGGVFVHEIAHTYDGGVLTDQNRELYNNADWDNSQLYYANNHLEMWACAVSAYVNALGGSHKIQNEPYYTSALIPHMNSVFNTGTPTPIITILPETVKDNTIEIKGTAEAGSIIKLLKDGNPLSPEVTAVVDIGWNWTLIATLTQGDNIFTATASDGISTSEASDPVTIILDSALGNDDFETTNIYILPNPTRGVLNITVAEKAYYMLLNIRGQILKKGVLATGESKINISSLAKGIYFLNIKTNRGSFTEKIIKN